DQVDGLRRALGEDDLLALPGPDEGAHLVARALVELRRLLTQGVDRPVNVRVRALVEETDGVEHLARLLGGRCGVEVDEPPAPDRARQDWKVRADAVGQAHRRSPEVPWGPAVADGGL